MLEWGLTWGVVGGKDTKINIETESKGSLCFDRKDSVIYINYTQTGEDDESYWQNERKMQAQKIWLIKLSKYYEQDTC